MLVKAAWTARPCHLLVQSPNTSALARINRKSANSRLHSLLPIPVVAAPGSPKIRDAGHGAPALQSLKSKCMIVSFLYRAFGEGPDRTNPCHIWKGEKQCLHKYSNGENMACCCCLKKKCLSAVNQPLENIHEEQNNSPSAKP